MILTRDLHHGDYVIRSYQPGILKVNDQLYKQSIVLGPHLLQVWEPKNCQELKRHSVMTIIDHKPDLVLLGTGEHFIFLDKELLNIFKQHEIGIEVMSTLSACHTFNVLMSEGRNAIAALLIF